MDAIKNSVKTRHYRHEKKIEDGAEEKTQLVEEQKLRQEEAPTKRRATKRKQKKRRKKGKTETVAGFIDRRRRPVERTSPPAIPFSFFPFFRFLFFSLIHFRRTAATSLFSNHQIHRLIFKTLLLKGGLAGRLIEICIIPFPFSLDNVARFLKMLFTGFFRAQSCPVLPSFAQTCTCIFPKIISHLHGPATRLHQVLRLHHTRWGTCDREGCQGVRGPARPTSGQEFHDEVEVDGVLERVVHLDHPLVVGLGQDVALGPHVRHLRNGRQ